MTHSIILVFMWVSPAVVGGVSLVTGGRFKQAVFLSPEEGSPARVEANAQVAALTEAALVRTRAIVLAQCPNGLHVGMQRDQPKKAVNHHERLADCQLRRTDLFA